MKKLLTEGVTKRWLLACGDIVFSNIQTKGDYRTKTLLAESLGINRQAFNNFERGTNVTVEAIAKLVETHHVNAQWLFTGKGERFITSQPTDPAKAIITRLRMLESRVSALETKKQVKTTK
jgi:predicted transcriptional regulator